MCTPVLRFPACGSIQQRKENRNLVCHMPRGLLGLAGRLIWTQIHTATVTDEKYKSGRWQMGT